MFLRCCFTLFVWLAAHSSVARAQPALRGVTIGPIESSQHPGLGYGSDASIALLDELVRLGANAISITPFGRIWSLSSTHISHDFEWPFEQNRAGIEKLVRAAKVRGLRVLLIPHLWVESGGWRGEIDPGSESAWLEYQAQYRAFVLRWAAVARAADVDIFSIGVECKSWSGRFAPYWLELIRSVRDTFHGELTYSANWDEADSVLFWEQLDYVGINAFYPLASHDQASYAEYDRGARAALQRAGALGELAHKRVLFVEIGYTTRPNAAVEPWLWPETMHEVHVDEWEQARALAALMGAAAAEPWLSGVFVWRYYSSLDDVSQEAAWGFSPHGKLAERVLANVFATQWASDPTTFAFTAE